MKEPANPARPLPGTEFIGVQGTGWIDPAWISNIGTPGMTAFEVIQFQYDGQWYDQENARET
jgi:hypothetical protein